MNFCLVRALTVSNFLLSAINVPLIWTHSLSYLIIVKLEFWTPSSNSWYSSHQVQPLALICQIKKHGEGQRKEIYYMAQNTCGKRQSKCLVHLLSSLGYMSVGARDKRYTSHRYGLADHYLSPCSSRVLEKLLLLPSLEGRNLASKM
jgi:hypothetical protein